MKYLGKLPKRNKKKDSCNYKLFVRLTNGFILCDDWVRFTNGSKL